MKKGNVSQKVKFPKPETILSSLIDIYLRKTELIAYHKGK